MRMYGWMKRREGKERKERRESIILGIEVTEDGWIIYTPTSSFLPLFFDYLSLLHPRR
jgi:hypothetical protein